MNTATWVQIPEEAVSISHSTNTFGKYLDPALLPPAKWVNDWIDFVYHAALA